VSRLQFGQGGKAGDGFVMPKRDGSLDNAELTSPTRLRAPDAAR